MEVEAMSSGYLNNITIAIGEKVPVGTPIAMLTDSPEG
jgi:pyruvate/2-oxoglutarate dehydrogenase complex dihydrolipoamide acyltransferase (E2) component